MLRGLEDPKVLIDEIIKKFSKQLLPKTVTRSLLSNIVFQIVFDGLSQTAT